MRFPRQKEESEREKRERENKSGRKKGRAAEKFDTCRDRSARNSTSPTLPIGVAGFEGGEKDVRRMASAITWSTRDIRDFACDDK